MTEPRRSEPIRWDPQILADFPGRWVALQDGVVIADGTTATELVGALMAEPDNGWRDRAVVQRVPHPDDVTDMGWMSLSGAW